MAQLNTLMNFSFQFPFIISASARCQTWIVFLLSPITVLFIGANNWLFPLSSIKNAVLYLFVIQTTIIIISTLSVIGWITTFMYLFFIITFLPAIKSRGTISVSVLRILLSAISERLNLYWQTRIMNHQRISDRCGLFPINFMLSKVGVRKVINIHCCSHSVKRLWEVTFPFLCCK